MFFYFAAEPYQPGHRWRSSNDDIGKIYDSATPNPTGSLSGPWIDEGYGSSKNVTGNATEMLSFCRKIVVKDIKKRIHLMAQTLVLNVYIHDFYQD